MPKRHQNRQAKEQVAMVAEVDHYYVPKKATDYVLWNRLNQVTIAARLDEGNQQ
jgi:hypothetical protein